jgi:hypothetical protein
MVMVPMGQHTLSGGSSVPHGGSRIVMVSELPWVLFYGRGEAERRWVKC